MKYIIASLTGAIIGYFTNWVAIKMLFRPYTEKKILGMKVPFTPGLIPKERGRIAKSVGDTVSNHLLTEEALIENISNSNVTDPMKKWVEKNLTEIIERESSLKIELQGLLGEDYDALIKHGNEALVELICREIKKPKFSEAIVEIVCSKAKELLKQNPKYILSEKFGIELKEILRDNLDKCVQSQQFRESLKDIIHNKLNILSDKNIKLNEVLTEEIIANLKVMIFNNRYEIVSYLESLLEEEKYQIKIKKLIDDIISTKLNPMVAMFMNSSNIFDKLSEGIKDMLKEEKKIVDIVLFINETLDKLMNISVKEILNTMPKEGINSMEDKICGFILDNMNRENLLSLSTLIEGKIYSYNSIEEIIKEFNVDDSKFKDYLKNTIDIMLNSSQTKVWIKDISNSVIGNIETLKLKNIFGSRAIDLPAKVPEVVIKVYNNFIEANGVALLRKLNIAQIVEDNINKFDVEYGEKIILDIAKKELSAITWLGGLLGGLIGILSPILASLY